MDGITVIPMRFDFDRRKSARLRANPKRGTGFEEAQEIFAHPYYLDQRSDLPEQYRAIGWVGKRLYTVIFEVREDGFLYVLDSEPGDEWLEKVIEAMESCPTQAISVIE